MIYKRLYTLIAALVASAVFLMLLLFSAESREKSVVLFYP